RDPHIVLELRHMLFDRRLLGEGPRQHQLGFEHGVQRRVHHPVIRWMAATLDGIVDGAKLISIMSGAKAELKALMPEDAKEAIGHGIKGKRSKIGAVSFELLSIEQAQREEQGQE